MDKAEEYAEKRFNEVLKLEVDELLESSTDAGLKAEMVRAFRAGEAAGAAAATKKEIAHAS